MELLKTEQVNVDETIRNSQEIVTQHEFIMQQMTKVIDKMPSKNDTSTNIANNVLETRWILNLDETTEANDLQLEHIKDEGKDTMNTQKICQQTDGSTDIKYQRENIDVLKDMILRLPATGLQDLEKVLKSSEKKLSHYLSQVQRSRATNELNQNVTDDLNLRKDFLLKMKRNLLETVYTVCSRNIIYQEHVKNSASGRLSPVIEDRGRGDDEYFHKTLVVPKLKFNRTENSEMDRGKNNTSGLQSSKISMDRSKQRESEYSEYNDNYVVFKGYNSSTKVEFDNHGKKSKAILTKRIRSIASMIVSAFSHAKNRKYKASCNVSAFGVQTGNDVIAVMSDISVLSKKDDVNKKPESLVPKLDFSYLESPRKDTSSIPLVVSLSASDNSCLVSSESRNKSKMSKYAVRTNGQKKKNIFARFRSFVKGKK